jgi:hypothetical protein
LELAKIAINNWYKEEKKKVKITLQIITQPQKRIRIKKS